MKSFVIALSMIVSTASFATVAVYHDYSEVLGAIKLDNACVTDMEVRSIDPVRVCTQLEARTSGAPGEIGVQTDWVCVKWENKDLSSPRAFERTVCLKNAPVNEAHSGECLQYGKKSDFLPGTISVRTTVTHGEASSERVSSFTFPACE
jgi:hypothetical protein